MRRRKAAGNQEKPNQSFTLYPSEIRIFETAAICRCQRCVHAKEYVIGRLYCTNQSKRERIGLDGAIRDCDAWLVDPDGFCEKGEPRP